MAEAIAAGDAIAVRALGGTPGQVVSALNQEYERNYERRAANANPGNTERLARMRADLDSLLDSSSGAFQYFEAPGPGMTWPDGSCCNRVVVGLSRPTASGCIERVEILQGGGYAVRRCAPGEGWKPYP